MTVLHLERLLHVLIDMKGDSAEKSVCQNRLPLHSLVDLMPLAFPRVPVATVMHLLPENNLPNRQTIADIHRAPAGRCRLTSPTCSQDARDAICALCSSLREYLVADMSAVAGG